MKLCRGLQRTKESRHLFPTLVIETKWPPPPPPKTKKKISLRSDRENNKMGEGTRMWRGGIRRCQPYRKTNTKQQRREGRQKQSELYIQQLQQKTCYFLWKWGGTRTSQGKQAKQKKNDDDKRSRGRTTIQVKQLNTAKGERDEKNAQGRGWGGGHRW